MPRYILTERASSDLEEIWKYTDLNWGTTQARVYLTQLENRMIALARYPDRGRKRRDLSREPMSYHEGRHVIFYSENSDGIEVLCILHDSMDFARHL